MTAETHYKATPIPVDGTVTIQGSRVGGVIAATAGVFTFTIITGEGPNVVLPGIPLEAGQELDIGFYVGSSGRSTLVASEGGSGILFTS